MKYGRLWVARSARCGFGWPLSALAGASWLGCWAAGAPARLWQALPRRYHRHTRYFTDAWRAYPQVLLTAAHRVGKTGTRVVEALNGKLRHRCGVLMRRSRSFSKCRASHYNRIKIAIDQHNLEITLN